MVSESASKTRRHEPAGLVWSPACAHSAHRRGIFQTSVVGQFDYGRETGLIGPAVGAYSRMAKRYRIRLLEVKVIPLKPDKWEWQVCDDDTPIVTGYETTRETAQIKGDSALFLLLSEV
jgi:hypothetical protein